MKSDRSPRPWSLVALLLPLMACAGPSAPVPTPRAVVSDGWLAMGTFFEADLRVRPEEVPRARAWLEWARLEIARLEAVYSRHDPESAISALNRDLEGDRVLLEPTVLSPELESILFTAIGVWTDSEGAFDVSVGPLVEVWRDAADRGRWPARGPLRVARQRVGSEKLLLLGNGELVTTMPNLRIDLDGLSKGAVLDRLRERFELDLPEAAALLDLGESSFVAIGDPDGEGWRLMVRSREASRGDLGSIRLRDRALSVSSSVGSVHEIDGRLVSHVIDPRTGAPVEGAVEAIVLADRAGIADAWSTALLVLGAEESAVRLAENAGLDVIVFDASGRSVQTPGWEEEAQGRKHQAVFDAAGRRSTPSDEVRPCSSAATPIDAFRRARIPVGLRRCNDRLARFRRRIP